MTATKGREWQHQQTMAGNSVEARGGAGAQTAQRSKSPGVNSIKQVKAGKTAEI